MTNGERRRPTITDIAQAAGLSTATVSHVFSGKQPVTPETAEVVRRIADELGYRPSPTARALATGRSLVLAVHSSFAGEDAAPGPFLASSIVTVSAAASARGYALILLPAEAAAACAELTRLAEERRVDGVIFLDPSPDDAQIASVVAEFGLAHISTGKFADTSTSAWVDGDVPGQMRDGLEHLVVRGYRQPALLTFAGDRSFLRESEAAYRSWAAERDLEARVFRAPVVSSEAGRLGVADLRRTGADSILCTSDLLIAPFVSDLRDAGIGLVGTGDSAQAGLAGLTSIATGALERARIAADLLADVLDRPGSPVLPVTTSHQLIVRSSTPQREERS